MTAQLSPCPVFKAFGNDGTPLAYGLLYSYAAGTSTPQATYVDSTQSTPNTNPIKLNARGECALWLDPTLSYKLNLTDSLGNQIAGYPVDNITGPLNPSGSIIPSVNNAFDLGSPSFEWRNIYAGTQVYVGTVPVYNATAGIVGYYGQTAAELAASVTPANYAYQAITPPRYGALVDGSTNDTSSINAAILVAKQTGSGTPGAAGEVINLTFGTSVILSEITLPDNVRFLGANKNGSIIQASASWNSGTYPFMLNANNGSSSMFDSILESMTIDCNNIANLTAVQTSAWQENSGLRRCLLYRFTQYGLWYYGTGYATSGGAAFNKIEDVEMFASNSGATAGVQVDQISSVGSFVLSVKNVTIAAESGGTITKGINIVNDSSSMDTVHFEACTHGVYLAGVGRHTLRNLVGNASVTNVVTIDSGFTGTVTMINCLRGGATHLINDLRSGGVGAIASDLPLWTSTASNGFAISADNTAKAWCIFNGASTGTNAPTAGFNVASVTRNSAGNYTVTFTNALTSSNSVFLAISGLSSYCVTYSGTHTGAGSANFIINALSVSAGAMVETPTDSNPVMFTCFGLGT